MRVHTYSAYLLGDGDGAAYVWKKQAGVRFLEEETNLEMLVSGLERMTVGFL